jgi:hypothetical protein
VVEVGGPDDEVSLPQRPGLAVTWLHRGEAPGGTTALVTTMADGLATSPPFSANGQPGTFVATAATPTGESATFELVNDATVAEIPAWGALGQLLTMLGVIVVAAARLRRREA